MRLPANPRSLLLCAPLLLTACASMGPPQPPSLDLPKPPTDLKAVRKGDHVILTWGIPALTTDRQTIRTLGPTRICRGIGELTDCTTPVAQTSTATAPARPSKFSKAKPTIASFTDTLPLSLLSIDPSARVSYAIEVLNSDRRGAGLSNQIQVPAFRAPAPPTDFHAQLTAQGVVLSWTPDASTPNTEGVHTLYRVYRRLDGTEQQVLAADLPLSGQSRFSVTDSAFEWEKTYFYRVEAVAVISFPGKPDIQIEGEDSPELKLFADDTFPPAVPTGLQAVFSGPGQQPFIDLVWAPVTDLDLDGYNLYRHEAGHPPVKVNPHLVKNPAYRDTSVLPGHQYTYSVSAMDVRGNESARSDEATESVPQ